MSRKADCPPGYDSSSVRIVIFEVKARRARSVEAEPLGGSARPRPERGSGVAARGSGLGLTDIHASTGGKEDRTLDSGNIDPASLAIEITILSSTRDGAERFARL